MKGNGTGGLNTPAAQDLISLGGGSQPWAIAVADFNRDHILDLAVVERGTAKLTILNGGANGTFAAPVRVSTGTLPSAVVVGDWDRDGDDDIAVVCEGANSLQLFNNAGIASGTFALGPSYTTGTQPAGLTAADLNMDGFVDMAVAVKGQNRVDVFLGLGNGKFAFSQSFTTAAQPVSIAVGHLENDSKPDLMVACASGVVSRLRSNQYRVPELMTFATPLTANINLSRRSESDAETAIAINRANPNNIVAFSIGPAASGGGLVRAYSLNGGRTWLPTLPVPPPGDNPQARIIFPSTPSSVVVDPSAAFDRFGNLYLAYVEIVDGLPTTFTVKIARSTDGGNSFTIVATIPDGNPDQPTVVTGPGRHEGVDSVWVAMANGIERVVGAEVSGLGGTITFSPFQEVSLDVQGNFGDLTVGPNGQVMVSFRNAQDGKIVSFIDPDGLGVLPFQQTSAMTQITEDPPYHLPAEPRTVVEEIGLAWDRSNSHLRNRLYMVHCEARPTNPWNTQNVEMDTDIVLRFSDDFGNNWSELTRVNHDSTTRSQFHPRLAIDQTTGEIAIGFYDASVDTMNIRSWYIASRSVDGGRHLTFPKRVALATSDANLAPLLPQCCYSGSKFGFGDYTSIDYYKGIVMASWSDNSNSTSDNPEPASMELYTSRLTINRK